MAQEGYDRVKSLATEFPNIAKSVKAPEQTWGYMNKAATVIGYQNASYVTFNTVTDASTGQTYQAPTGSTTALTGANASRAVLLRSKAWGHEGGNGITAQLVDPGAPSSRDRGHGRRQGDHGPPRHERRRRDRQHRPGRHHRDQRHPGGLGAGDREPTTAPRPRTASSSRASSPR